MTDEDWINLVEAAELAGCSRKTLYRYMTKNHLRYRKAENNRRYVQRQTIEALFPPHQRKSQTSLPKRADLEMLVSVIESLSTEIKTQSALLEKMVALYQPKTFAELLTKRENTHKKG